MNTFLENSDQERSLSAKVPELTEILASLFAILDALKPTTMPVSLKSSARLARLESCLSDLAGGGDRFFAVCISFSSGLVGDLVLDPARDTGTMSAEGGELSSVECGVREGSEQTLTMYSKGSNRSSKSSYVG